MTSKRVIITAGPTSEPIDQVRRLTNHSTGSLGSQLAERCREEGYEVVMLRSRHCVVPPPRGLDQVIPFETTDDLLARLKELSKFPACALFHAAAVSDFKPGGIFVEGEGGWNALSEGKVSSRQEQVMLRLVPTSKIIAQLRSWFPNAAWWAGNMRWKAPARIGSKGHAPALTMSDALLRAQRALHR